jgi:hypothetical protein
LCESRCESARGDANGYATLELCHGCILQKGVTVPTRWRKLTRILDEGMAHLEPLAMRHPVYWARATFVGRDALGAAVHRWAWGWSATDQADALAMAKRRAMEATERAASGLGRGEAYGYGVDPAREPLLHEPLDEHGEPIGAVTRNRYGCEVLNAFRVMFVDIDFSEESIVQPKRSWFQRLFGRPRQFRREVAEPALLDRLRRWHQRRPGTPVRIYRTAGGLRAIVADRLYDPSSRDARDLMQSLHADQLYVWLCVRQHTFRARLTPKPWRIGLKTFRCKFPLRTPDEERRQAAWEREYYARRPGYATCEVACDLGPPIVDSTVQALLALHDSYALNPGRPLA